VPVDLLLLQEGADQARSAIVFVRLLYLIMVCVFRWLICRLAQENRAGDIAGYTVSSSTWATGWASRPAEAVGWFGH